MDIVTVLQVAPEVVHDAERRARVQALVDRVAEHYSLEPVPRPDEVGSITIVGLRPPQVKEVLDSESPGWRDEGLFEVLG